MDNRIYVVVDNDFLDRSEVQDIQIAKGGILKLFWLLRNVSK